MMVSAIRRTLARFVLIITLGFTIATGTFAVGGVSDAAAMPISCEVAMGLSDIHLTHAGVWSALGNDYMYWFHMGKAETYLKFC